MKEVYSYDFNWWQRFLQKAVGLRTINSESIDFSWGYFVPKFGFELVLNQCTYGDDQHRLAFCLGWGKFSVKVPWLRINLGSRSKMPRYGISIHDRILWIYGRAATPANRQRDYWSFCLPFINIGSVDRYFYNGSEWQTYDYNVAKSQALHYNTTYSYVLKNGTIQHTTATCRLDAYVRYKYLFRRGWDKRLCKKVPWLKRWMSNTTYSVDISFETEIGEKAGSWKGGVVGCGTDVPEHLIKNWKLLNAPEEIMEQSVRLMEMTREFR